MKIIVDELAAKWTQIVTKLIKVITPMYKNNIAAVK